MHGPVALTSSGTHDSILSRYADALQVGKWQLLKDLEDPELRYLADVLPTTVLHSRANSSTWKYLGAFKRWEVGLQSIIFRYSLPKRIM